MPAGGLFGGHVIRGTEGLAGERDLGSLPQVLGQPEIGELRLVVRIQEDVGRLEVPVEDALGVGVVDGAGDGDQVPGRLVGG